MKVATIPSISIGWIRLLTIGFVALALAETADAQIWESPLLSKLRSQNLAFTRANIDPEPMYQTPVEAQLEGDYQLSCGAVLDPTPHEGYYLRAPKPEKNLSKAQASTINVNYIGDGWIGAHGDSAKTAFQRAVSTWETLLTSASAIRVDARFDSLAPNVLGSASSCQVWCFTAGGTLPQVDNTLYVGDALADKIQGSDVSPVDTCDIQARFNSNFSNFHFGADPPPGDKYDFETVVAHELGHGLNFTGFASVSVDTTDPGPPPVIDSTGTFFRGLCESSPGVPAPLSTGVYNMFTEDGGIPPLAAAKADDLAAIGVSLVDTAAYPESSTALARALLGLEGGVFWGDTLETTGGNFENFGYVANGSVRPPLYAPASWDQGSSFSHLNDADFNGTTDNMMTHALGLGEMGRGPGPVMCGILADMLWTVEGGQCAGLSLPVELVSFDVTIEDGRGLVRWATATEDDNAGFEIEMRTGDGPWTSVGFVEGAGRSAQRVSYEFTVADLGYGTHHFRLKQVDFDGSFVYSYEVEAVKAVPGQFVLSEAYPNPFNPTTNLNLVVGRTQEVAVELFDVAGRKVSTIMREEIGENEQRVIRIDGAMLPSGVYVVRVAGDNFITNRRIVLLK